MTNYRRWRLFKKRLSCWFFAHNDMVMGKCGHCKIQLHPDPETFREAARRWFV